jgi:hypothetical protein
MRRLHIFAEMPIAFALGRRIVRELFKIGTPVEILKAGKWYLGYYAGLTRYGTLHLVTTKKTTSSRGVGLTTSVSDEIRRR